MKNEISFSFRQKFGRVFAEILRSERCKSMRILQISKNAAKMTIWLLSQLSIQPRTSHLILFDFSSLQRFNFDRALASESFISLQLSYFAQRSKCLQDVNESINMQQTFSDILWANRRSREGPCQEIGFAIPEPGGSGAQLSG